MAGTCIIYCRTSTERQKVNETIEAQKTRCLQLVERHNLTLLPYGEHRGLVIDDGVSGRLLEGRQFKKLLEDIDQGRIHPKPQYLVIYSISRIARIDRVSGKEREIASAKDAAELAPILKYAGIQIIDEEGITDPNSDMFQFKLLFSSMEYRAIRQRTIAGKADRLSKGYFVKGGKPPWGYVQQPEDPKHPKRNYILVPDPNASKDLIRIFDWYIEGGSHFAARKAREANILVPMHKTSNRKNADKNWNPTAWNPITVHNLVKRARSYYTGEFEYVIVGNSGIVKATPIINENQYSQIVARQKIKTLKRRAIFLSSNNAKCECGANIVNTLYTNSGVHYFTCKKCRKAIKTSTVEWELWHKTIERLTIIKTVNEFKMFENKQNVKEKIESLRNRLALVNEQIATLLNALLEKLIEKTDWKHKNELLQNERASIRAEIEQLEKQGENTAGTLAKISAILEDYQDLFTSLDLDKQRKCLDMVLEGQRFIVQWGNRIPKVGKSSGNLVDKCMITFPQFGDLKPMTFTIVKKDRPEFIITEIDGVQYVQRKNKKRAK